jgi:hypothetical protein
MEVKGNVPVIGTKMQAQDMIDVAMGQPDSNRTEFLLTDKIRQNTLFRGPSAARIQNDAFHFGIPDDECVFAEGVEAQSFEIQHKRFVWQIKQLFYLSDLRDCLTVAQ